jgi:hypothetical protein
VTVIDDEFQKDLQFAFFALTIAPKKKGPQATSVEREPDPGRLRNNRTSKNMCVAIPHKSQLFYKVLFDEMV